MEPAAPKAPKSSKAGSGSHKKRAAPTEETVVAPAPVPLATPSPQVAEPIKPVDAATITAAELERLTKANVIDLLLVRTPCR